MADTVQFDKARLPNSGQLATAAAATPVTAGVAQDPVGDAPMRWDVAACRLHAEDAVTVIVDIMKDGDASESNRLRAAMEILERAWGKPIGDILDSEQSDLDAQLWQLGPREPAPPEVLQAGAAALRLYSDSGRTT